MVLRFKAQAAMEYVIVLSTLMLILSYTSYYVLSDSQQTMDFTSAQDAVDSLAKAADSVYSMGPCSKTYVYVNIPNSVVGSSVGNKVINLQVNSGGGVSDVFALTNGNVTGYLPSLGGRSYRIPVEMTCSGVLVIGGGFSIVSQEIRLNITQGGSGSAQLNLTNNRDVAITSIESNVSGGVSVWSTVNDLAVTIDSNSIDGFTVDFNIPMGTLSGAYSGTLIIRGSEDAIIEVPIMIYVDGVNPTSSSSSSSSSLVAGSSSSSSVASSSSSSSLSSSITTTSSSSTSSTTTMFGSSSSSSSSSSTTSSSSSSTSASTSSSSSSSSSSYLSISSSSSSSSSIYSNSSSSSSSLASSSAASSSSSSSSSSRSSSSAVTTTTMVDIWPQSCSAARQETIADSFPDACDGTYPQVCGGSGKDRLSCDDGNIEQHRADTNQYCGVKALYYNTSISNCNNIQHVEVCYEYRITSSSPANCDISVSSDGVSWSQADGSCYTAYPGVQCVDVTSAMSWTCNDFFTANGAYLRQNAMSNQNTKNCQIDVLYYAVSYS